MNNDRTYAAITGRLARVQDSLGEEHPIIPASEIIARARGRRVRRRLISGMTGTLALAAGAVVAVTALLPASHQPSHPAQAQLAAWTVAKQADGTVLVKIRQFRDPAGLQRRLRADGVPASIIFIRHLRVVHINTSPCRQFNGGHWSDGQLLKVAHLLDPQAAYPFQHGLVIDASALPRRAGIQFYITTNLGYSSPQHHGGTLFLEGLVQASPGCTGS